MKIALKKRDMRMKCKQCEAVFTLNIPVDLWEEVGLAIHETTTGWRVSHYSSGKAIIRYIPDRKAAIQVMARLYREVLKDWTPTEETMYISVKWEAIKRKMNAIQRNYTNEKSNREKEPTKERKAAV